MCVIASDNHVISYGIAVRIRAQGCLDCGDKKLTCVFGNLPDGVLLVPCQALLSETACGECESRAASRYCLETS